MFLQLLEEMLTLIGGLIVAYFVYLFIVKKDGNKNFKILLLNLLNLLN